MEALWKRIPETHRKRAITRARKLAAITMKFSDVTANLHMSMSESQLRLATAQVKASGGRAPEQDLAQRVAQYERILLERDMTDATVEAQIKWTHIAVAYQLDLANLECGTYGLEFRRWVGLKARELGEEHMQGVYDRLRPQGVNPGVRTATGEALLERPSKMTQHPLDVADCIHPATGRLDEEKLCGTFYLKRSEHTASDTYFGITSVNYHAERGRTFELQMEGRATPRFLTESEMISFLAGCTYVRKSA